MRRGGSGGGADGEGGEELLSYDIHNLCRGAFPSTGLLPIAVIFSIYIKGKMVGDESRASKARSPQRADMGPH